MTELLLLALMVLCLLLVAYLLLLRVPGYAFDDNHSKAERFWAKHRNSRRGRRALRKRTIGEIVRLDRAMDDRRRS